MVSQVF
jgi:hypothetical protein